MGQTIKASIHPFFSSSQLDIQDLEEVLSNVQSPGIIENREDIWG